MATESKPRRIEGYARGVLLSMILGGVLAGSAFLSSSDTYARGSFWGGSHRGWGHGDHDAADPERARDHAQRAAGWMLAAVDATDAQEAEVAAIVDASVQDMFDLRGEHAANREALIAELSRDTIDRDAIEQIRVAEIALADDASRRLVDALVGVAEALTPEQRNELIELADSFHH